LLIAIKIDEKNKQIESEDHLKQINERQNGRIEEDLKKLDDKSIEIQERLNDLQN
jgi:predicted nuclease with TOPRIM domain